MENFDYPFEDHGDASVDERWRKTLNRQASQGGFPLASVPERLSERTPFEQYRESVAACNEILPEWEQARIRAAARLEHQGHPELAAKKRVAAGY